jgi:hypothetical protein
VQQEFSAARDRKPPGRAGLEGSPAGEAGADPAPTRHAPATEEQGGEKSKFAATEVWRSKKGDRFV